MLKNPLELDFGDDPVVVDFIRRKYSGAHRHQLLPPLTTAQLAKVDECVCMIDDACDNHMTFDTITQYMNDNVVIVAGAFCGGTKYAQGFLSRMGYRAGHEEIFSSASKLYGKSLVGCQPEIEVSGSAPAWLACFPNTRRIALVRHPVDCINSRYYFLEKKDGEHLYLQRDLLNHYELMFGSTPPAFVWRIESLSDQLNVLEFFGHDMYNIPPEKLVSARKANRNSKKKEGQVPIVTWDTLIPPLRQWAEDFRYTEKGLPK